MKSLGYLVGMFSFALVVSALSASPVIAAAAGSDEPKVTYYLCGGGTLSTTPCAQPEKTTSVVEQPSTKPAPTVAAATPPLNIVCKLPMVATLRADKWQCIVPASTKLGL